MIIKSLKLTNYRNHNDLHLIPDESVNLIIGDNGTGKTNILEAVHLLSTTKSFRAKYDRDLISYDKEFALIEARIESSTETEKLQLQIIKTPRSEHTSKKTAKLNNVSKSLNNFTHYLKSVLFTPEDIELITGSPSLRRKFMDLVLYQVEESYRKNLRKYLKAVRQRNKLLEKINLSGEGEDQLPYWNSQLLELGEYIQQKRSEFFAQLNNYFNNSENPHYRYSKTLEIIYEKNVLDTKRLLEYKNREIAAKRTLLGPHLDDFSLLFENREMSQFSSRGEQRTAVFLMKIAEYEYIRSKTNDLPVLLLDDIFSELDPEHKESILSFINSKQTLITSTTDNDLPGANIAKTINLN
jgi:DNA replication and repair protein RecF